MREKLFANDSMSAVMVPVGYTLVVYSDDGFQGSSDTYEGMVNEVGTLACQPVKNYHYDQMSSLMVMKSPYAKGHWSLVATDSFWLEYTLGVTSTTSATVTTEMTDTLTKEMTTGITFKHSNMTDTLSKTHQESVMRSTTSTYS